MENAPAQQTMAALWQSAAREAADLPLACTRLGPGEWRALTYGELWTRATALAAALQARGLPARALVGLFADHGEGWLIGHVAIQILGAADVPRGTDVSDGDLRHIGSLTAMAWAMVATPALARRLHAAVDHDCCIVVLSGAADDGDCSLQQLEDEGRALLADDGVCLDDRLAGISAEDRHAVIFTSATTGIPKGVVLSHRGMLAQCDAIAGAGIELGIHDRLLSLLPVWHIFERTMTLYAMRQRASLWFTSPRRFAEDLAAVQPTFMASAPRLWEALDQRIHKALREAHPLRRALVRIGRWCSRHYRASWRVLSGCDPRLQPIPRPRLLLRWLVHALRWLAVMPLHGLFNTAVLERIRMSTGACLKGTVSGGGALPAAVDSFFTDLGLPVLEGYGMTEFPVISVRRPGRAIPGTVGPLLPGVDLRLVDPEDGSLRWSSAQPQWGQRGEIQVRGAMCMDGYYENPEANGQAFTDDGWLRTGDLGIMGSDGALRIVGRCKDTIVLRSGENVEPGPIEDSLRRSALIDQAVVVGQDAKHLSVLIVPAAEACAEALQRSFGDEPLAALASDAQAQELIRREVQRLVCRDQGFKNFELIHGVALLPAALTVGVEVTNLLKIRRHVVYERYAAQIAALEQQP